MYLNLMDLWCERWEVIYKLGERRNELKRYIYHQDQKHVYFSGENRLKIARKLKTNQIYSHVYTYMYVG